MAKQPIRNFWGRQVATIEDGNHGYQYIYDFYGRCLGHYDPKTNDTYDFYGRRVGSGNILTSLIKKWD